MIQYMVFAVEGGHFFTVFGSSHNDMPIRYGMIIKCMQGLAHFQHHIVCNIHNIGNRAHARRQQTALHPARGIAPHNVCHHTCGVPRTQLLFLHFYADMAASQLLCFLRFDLG